MDGLTTEEQRKIKAKQAGVFNKLTPEDFKDSSWRDPQATSAEYRNSISGILDEWFSGGQGAKAIDDAAAAAAELKDDKAAQKLLWASATADVGKALYGDGSPDSGILNQFAKMKKEQIAAGFTNKKEVMDSLASFEQKYMPFFQSIVDSAGKSASQLAELAGTELGTSKSYLSQLALGTRALNQRLSATGLLSSSTGNDQYSDFVMKLGGQEETRREALLQGNVDNGLRAATGIESTGQFNTNTLAGQNQNNVSNAITMGTNQAQFGLSGAQLMANTQFGVGSQQLGAQGLLYDQLKSDRTRADNAADEFPRFIGAAVNTASKFYNPYPTPTVK